MNDIVCMVLMEPTLPGSVPLNPFPSQYACCNFGNFAGTNTSGKVPVSAQKLQLYFSSSGFGRVIGGSVPEMGLRPSLWSTNWFRLSISGGSVPDRKFPLQ